MLRNVRAHRPVAVAIGRAGQSQWAAVPSLLAQMPKGAVPLANRLYGCPVRPLAAQILAVCARGAPDVAAILAVESHIFTLS